MKILLSILFILCAIISVAFINLELYTYAIISITITVLLFIYLVTVFFEKKTPESIYNKILRDLIKTYDSILVDVEKIPELDVKNVINVSSFEKLLDVQYELKKPIFYKMSINSCSFILLDSEIAYVFVLRVSEDSFSPLDEIIAAIESDSKKRKEAQKILDNIEKTTIIKLDGIREYKVSPIREKDLQKVKETEFFAQLTEEFLPKLKKK